ncbi:hypothetical protein [Cryobacterium fucosi]|uniref:Uncharacterized protein n=1 Tax=Cryobacterium fucosi TaxID=1259157 RepID=A0A4R9B3H7_9MICO|nr:hypothetical protein [Cryobacterium fucosi]TFD75016.1 hypothetical protein E3T48_11990 [Cryobacterium fucosi]
MAGYGAGAAFRNDVNAIDVTSAEGKRRLVDIVEISPVEWCVRDSAIPADDPRALRGFIQRVGGAFEVTNLHRLRERSYYSSFDAAAASLESRSTLAGAVR